MLESIWEDYKEKSEGEFWFQRSIIKMGIGTTSKLWTRTTVIDSYEKSFDTHFVSSGLLWQYLVIQSWLSLYQPVQLFFVKLLMGTLRGKLLSKRHIGKCWGPICKQQTLKGETLK